MSLVFEHESETGIIEASDTTYHTSVARTVGLYSAVLTVLIVHILLVAIAYNVMVLDRPVGTTVLSFLGISGVNFPETRLAGGIIMVCFLSSILVHELGHVVSHRCSGVRVKAVGVEVFLVIPIRFYTRYHRCDWRGLSPRVQATTEAAGIATNLLVSAVAFVLFLGSGSQLVAWVYLSNTGVAVVSAVPLLGTDGDRLLAYVVLGRCDGEDTGDTGPLALAAGLGSWIILVGSALAIFIAKV